MGNSRYIVVFSLLALTASFWVSNAYAAPGVSTGSYILSSQYLVNVFGTVNPNGSPTEAWAEYGVTTSLGTPYGRQSVGTGTNPVDVKVWIPRLQPDTTYYYRIVAQSGGYISYGEIKSFTTSGTGTGSNGTGTGGSGTGTGTGTGTGSGGSGTGTGTGTGTGSGTGSGSSAYTNSPSVVTHGPASVGSNQAIVNGAINPNNLSTDFWFEFGTTPSLGKTTTTQVVGNGGAWKLVAGDLSALQPGKTYYYQLVGRNSMGVMRGNIMSFTTQGLNITSANTGNQTGSVLGAVSNINNNIPVSTGQDSSRPSFMSLEYSLRDDGPLVLVANDIRPKPGDTFSYTIVYKNDTEGLFNDTNLKVMIPVEAVYESSNIEPLTSSGNIVDFNLGTIQPGQQGAVVVVVRIKDDVASGTNIIFTSVLGYATRQGVQLASTTYMTIKVGERAGVAGASFWSSLINSSAMLWLIAFSLVVMLGVLIYSILRMRKREEEPDLSQVLKEEIKEPEPEQYIPPTFEPIDELHLQIER